MSVKKQKQKYKTNWNDGKFYRISWCKKAHLIKSVENYGHGQVTTKCGLKPEGGIQFIQENESKQCKRCSNTS